LELEVLVVEEMELLNSELHNLEQSILVVVEVQLDHLELQALVDQV
jgi:hypothetical protein